MVQGHALSWRAPDGGVRTTVVGKMSMALTPRGASLVAAEPLVHFDRIAADRRFVDEVSELMPWTANAALVVRGGPLRVEIQGDGGDVRTIEVKEGAPVGISMASEARSRMAKQPLSRGSDGLLVIAPGIDPRYFTAAPPWQGIEPMRGNERFVIDRSGQRLVVGPLPSVALVADVVVGPRSRRVALGFDLVVLDATRSRISFVARALLEGVAELRAMRLTTHGDVGTSDTGDAPPVGEDTRARKRMSGTMAIDASGAARPSSPGQPTSSAASPPLGPRAPASTGPHLPLDDEPTNFMHDPPPAAASRRRAPERLASTAPISPALLARTAMPFPVGPKRADARPEVPATPFDRGFAPVPPTPAGSVGRTVSGSAYPDMTLPVEGVPAATRAATSAPAAGSPEEAWSALPSPPERVGHAELGSAEAESDSTQDDGPRVAAPRKGAMAKPRPRKR